MAKNNLKHQAYSLIKEKIINCEFAPGVVFNEEFLCEEVNTSRTPVRDALSRLEQEGLIKIMPKRGIMVTELSLKDVNMVFEMRLLLEPYAIKQYGYALDEDTMLNYYQYFSLPSEGKSDKTFFQIDDEFHLWIVSAANNIYLRNNYELLHNQNLRFRILTGKRSVQRLEQTCAEHIEILKACIKKDWNTAAQAMEAHLIQSKECTFELLLAKQLEEAGYQKTV